MPVVPLPLVQSGDVAAFLAPSFADLDIGRWLVTGEVPQISWPYGQEYQ
ncbi:hypothetical protein [Amycolatopsis sp. H20-H5]|nr:hypothetical protein [Amycolatopsis sp. H20-H5]MEC3977769.1 hypothetical protein [Amycolatopsis sp. H20-H5]